jgi:hypothetical protein
MNFEIGLICGLCAGIIIGMAFMKYIELKKKGFELKWIQTTKKSKGVGGEEQ